MIVAAPLQQSIVRGGKATFVVSVRGINGFRGRVTLYARILPDNQVVPGSAWSTQPVTLALNGTATSTLTIVTNSATPAGANAITLEGRSGEIQEDTTIMLTVR